MSVVKVIRIVGTSPQSWAKAASAASQEAAKTIRDIQGVEATDFTAKVDESGRIVEYRTTVNIAFVVRGKDVSEEAGGSRAARGATRGGAAGTGRSGSRR
jgi:flavin-binding protein dodecin